MSFIQDIDELPLTYVDRDANFADLNWTVLNQHKLSTDYMTPTMSQKYSHYNNCGASIDAYTNLARLIREIGHRVNAVYGANGTSTSIYDMFNLAQSLYPNKDISFYYSTETLFNNLLDENKVAYVCGSDAAGTGHAWIADGTLTIKTSVTYYEEGKIIWTKTIGDDKYIHYNWGWNGSCNGYYLDGVFTPTQNPEQGISRSDYSGSMRYFTIKK